MTIQMLIDLCERRLSYLQGVKSSASNTGDIQQIDKLDTEIAATQTTLNQLKTL